MINLRELTIIIFIKDILDEKLLIKRDILNKYQNITIFSQNYTPKILKSAILTNTKNFEDSLSEVVKHTKTEWFIYLKPEEGLATLGDIFGPSCNSYFVNIITLINQHIWKNNLIHSEKRLFNKKFLTNPSEGVSSAEIYDYINSNYELIKRNLDLYLAKYKSGVRNIEILLFLLEKNIIKVPVESLIEQFINDNNKYQSLNKKEKLALYIYLLKNLILQKKFILAESLIENLEDDFLDSPDFNSLAGELKFLQKDYKISERYLLKCLELGDKKTFYKELPFSMAIIDYAAKYFLGKIYYEMEDYQKSNFYFEDCLKSAAFFDPAKKGLMMVKEKIELLTNNINMFDFACQGCGNCCRMFQAVAITHTDAIRILENRPDLKINDFSEMVKINTKNKKDKLSLSLKKRKNNNDCIFLDKNSRCEINSFKPVVCKIWPFGKNEKEEIIWGRINTEFIKKYCSYKLVKNNINQNELRADIDAHNRNSNEFEKIISEVDLIDPSANKIYENFAEIIAEKIKEFGLN